MEEELGYERVEYIEIGGSLKTLEFSYIDDDMFFGSVIPCLDNRCGKIIRPTIHDAFVKEDNHFKTRLYKSVD
jgi:hypothetical protein